jgi:hypothetical protein
MGADQVAVEVGVEVAKTGLMTTVTSYGTRAIIAVSNTPVAPIIAVGAAVSAVAAVWQYGNYKIAEEYRKMANDMLLNIKCPEGFYATFKITDGNPEKPICEQAVDIEKKVSVITMVAEKACGGSSNYVISIAEDNAVSYQCVHLHGEVGTEVFV